LYRIALPCLLGLAGLSACGGGGGTAPPSPSVSVAPPQPADPPVGPDVPTITLEPLRMSTARPAGFGISFLRPDYRAQSDTITYGDDTLQRVEDSLLPAGFAAYNDGTPAFRAVRGVTEGGQAIALRREGTGDIVVYERFGNTELPTLGRGTFTGTYAGTLGTRNAENRGTIVGIVKFDVDFGEREVSGVIDQRINQNGRDFDKLTLEPTELRDHEVEGRGVFQGVTSGGGSPFLGHAESRGFHGGLVVGEAADGIVGYVRIDHTGSATFVDLIENGAFVAERP
jgi:hypothetical protein